MKQIYSTLLLLVLLIFPSLLFATEPESVDRVPAIRGVVYDETDTPLASATVQIEGTTIGTTTNSEGRFILRNLARKVYKINVSFVGYATQTRTVDLTSRSVAQLSFTLLPDDNLLSTVEVFGERYKQPKKLDAITRMPLRPSEQIQSIYVILENFCLCLIQRTLGELPNFGVMIWQLYYMLRSALICFQVTRFRNKGNHFI